MRILCTLKKDYRILPITNQCTVGHVYLWICMCHMSTYNELKLNCVAKIHVKLSKISLLVKQIEIISMRLRLAVKEAKLVVLTF